MHIWGTVGVTAFALLALAGDPATLSFSPAPAAAANLVCASVNYGYNFCQTSNRANISLVQQLSNAPCIQGRSWGSTNSGIWVNRGCAASFRAGGSGGSVVGAAVVGGIVGAILGGAASNDGYRTHTNNYYYTPGYSEPSWMNRQRIQDAQDNAYTERQRGDYLANQNNQLTIQASQDRERADNARRDAQEARDNADQRAAYMANQERQKQQFADGEADENRQAREAEANANREAGEADENRQAREAEASANSDSNDSSGGDSSAEETPSSLKRN